MQRFYWVIQDQLAGCSLPGGNGRGSARDAEGAGGTTGAINRAPTEELIRDLAFLRQKGIRALLSLTEAPLPSAALAASDLDVLHLPVLDLHAPTPQQLDQAIAFIDQHSARSAPTAVHCLMGQGRTGTVLAAYLIRNGLTAAEALAEIRMRCDGAISAEEQAEALRIFARQRAWVV